MNRLYSFICCTSSGKSIRFKLSQTLVYSIVASLLVCFVGLFFSVGLNVYLFNFHAKSKNYVNEQELQAQVVSKLSSEILSLRYITEDLVEKEAALRQDLGRPKYRSLSKKKNIKRKLKAFKTQYPSDDQNTYVIHQLSNQIDYIKGNVLKLEKNMRRHVDVFTQYQRWFEEMPSIWPVFGHIQSKYGWRMHPISKRRQFHKGIDIPAWTGAPVQATADGYVEFSGWDGGYGWMVVISHNFSYRTIYGHLSEIDVVQGVRVSKGQIIGKIGTSGRSTGPHIHYEIRQGRKALDPMDYLDLDLFTAVSKLW